MPLFAEVPPVVEGMLVWDRPGLGLTLDESAVAHYAYDA